MIKKFNFGRIPQMEFLARMTNMKNHLAKADTATLGLTAVQTEFVQALTAFEEVLKPLQKSLLTEKLEQADNHRDRVLVGFGQHCRAFLSFPEKEKEEAAKKLVAEIDKFGKSPQDKPFTEETAIIHSLLKDLEQPENKQHLSAIGAATWIGHLAQANTDFERLYNERTYETSGAQHGLAKTLRAQTYESFKKLVQHINAFATIKGVADYKILIDNFNKEIDQAR